MAIERIPISPAGYERLKAELKRYQEVERGAAVRAIEVARAHGDLSENSEYDDAKERQGFVEGRIQELESRVSRCLVLVPAEQSSDRIVFGATVDLLDLDTDEEFSYQILGEDEADVENGKLSVRSPIARALIGKEEGDEVKIKVPRGIRMFEVLGFRYI